MVTRLQKDLAGTLQRARQEILDSADTFRRLWLLPFCQEHKLTFVARKNALVEMVNFYDIENKLVDPRTYPGLHPLYAALNLAVLGREDDVLGYYVKEITVMDL